VIAPQSDSHQMQEQNNCDPNENWTGGPAAVQG
jgi:hypothetical protein